jgi:Cu+-exporting ATPase
MTTTAAETTIDPICGMTVDPEKSQYKADYQKHTYYFCSPSCLAKFQADPTKAAKRHKLPNSPETAPTVQSKSATVPPQAGNAQWTCPMHPQIVRHGPGSCPICGMALEPINITASDENPELASMSRRFWVGVALTVPLLVLMVSDILPSMPIQHWVDSRMLVWLQFALATPVVLWGGLPFFERGWASLVNRSLKMFTLIAIGTG